MLPIKFGIDQIPATRQIADITLNIQDDYRHLVYTGKPQPHQIPISFIGMPDTSPKNIQIKDLNEIPGQVTLLENSHLARFRQRFYSSVFDLPSKFALITDVALIDKTGSPSPLFFKHIIPNGFATQPEVFDQDMNLVSADQYFLSVGSHEIALFHNLEPEYNTESGYIKVYYIRYTSVDGYQIFRLLESNPAYSEANILDFPGGEKRVYTVRRLRGKFRYRILHNSRGPFFVKLTRESQLKIKKPVVAPASDPWHISISDGELLAANGRVVDYYSIPEFHFQVFSPIEPVQYSGTQECLVMTNHLVVSPFQNILSDSDHALEILVTDDLLEPKFGYTTRNSTPRSFWVDRFGRWREQGRMIRFPLSDLDTAGISFSKRTGVIHMPVELLPTDRVFIRAFKEATDFKYLGLNLNPLHNRSMVAGHAIIYALPDSGLSEFQTAIQHIILDQDDNIIQWSDYRLGENNILIEGLLPGEGETGFGLFKDMFPKNLILGSVSITRNASIESMTFIDVREQGGDLTKDIEDNLSKYLDEYPELQWLVDDSISGRSLPIQGAFIVSIPFGILKEAGGDLERQDVETLVSRHASLGSFPIIQYYANKPEIVSVGFYGSDSNLEVVWGELTEYDSYRIYVSGDRENGNCFMDTVGGGGAGAGFLRAYLQMAGTEAAPDINLLATDKLYVHIAPMKNGIEWPSSDTVELDLTIQSGIKKLLLSAVISSPPVLETSLDAVLVEA